MKQSDALVFLPIIKAWGEGKTIKYRRYLLIQDGKPTIHILNENFWKPEIVNSWVGFVRWIDTEWQELEI